MMSHLPALGDIVEGPAAPLTLGRKRPLPGGVSSSSCQAAMPASKKEVKCPSFGAKFSSSMRTSDNAAIWNMVSGSGVGSFVGDGTPSLFLAPLAMGDRTDSHLTESSVQSSELSPTTTKEDEPSPVRNTVLFGNHFLNSNPDGISSLPVALNGFNGSSSAAVLSTTPAEDGRGKLQTLGSLTTPAPISATGLSLLQNTYSPTDEAHLSRPPSGLSSPHPETVGVEMEGPAPQTLKGMNQELSKILTSLLDEEQPSPLPRSAPVSNVAALVTLKQLPKDFGSERPVEKDSPVPEIQHRPHSPEESPPQGDEMASSVQVKSTALDFQPPTSPPPLPKPCETVSSLPIKAQSSSKLEMREPRGNAISRLSIEVPKSTIKYAKVNLAAGTDTEVLAALLPFYNSDAGNTDTDNADHSDSASSSFESPRQRPDSMGFGDVPSPLHIGSKGEPPVDIPTWDLATGSKGPPGVFDKAQNISTEAILQHEMQLNQDSPAFEETAARMSRENSQQEGRNSFETQPVGLAVPKRPSQTNFVSHLSTLGDDFKMNKVFASDGHLGPTGLTPQYNPPTPLLTTQVSSDSITTPCNRVSLGEMGYGFGENAGEFGDILEKQGGEKHSHLDESDGEGGCASPIGAPSQPLPSFPVPLPTAAATGLPLPAPTRPVASPSPPPTATSTTSEQGVEHHTVKQFYHSDGKAPPPSQKDKHCDENHTRLGPDFQVFLPALRPFPVLKNEIERPFDPHLEPLHIWSPSTDRDSRTSNDKYGAWTQSSYELTRRHLEHLIAKEEGSDAKLVFELSALLDKDFENQYQTRSDNTHHRRGYRSGPQWAAEAERAFVRGIYACRRNFSRLRKRYLPDKSVKEVVHHFYSNFKLSSRYKHWKQTPDLLVGRRIRKNFGSMGVFHGTITKYFSAQQTKSHRELFHIEYDDGDVEDLYRHELDNLLLPKQSNAEDDPP